MIVSVPFSTVTVRVVFSDSRHSTLHVPSSDRAKTMSAVSSSIRMFWKSSVTGYVFVCSFEVSRFLKSNPAEANAAKKIADPRTTRMIAMMINAFFILFSPFRQTVS